MKKLTNIFVAVAVALFALSCATDMTIDESVNLADGANGQTTLTLSLEETRTQLADKVGEQYPLVWGEGDQISLNGVVSSALSASQAGKAEATFSFNGVLEAPYCIAYPATNEGEVLFAAKQTHTANNTFSNGVATMYGYSEEGAGVTLNHLTGVLKIGVTGEATLSHAQISTIDRAPIAGAFAIDFTTGDVTPGTNTEAVINYSFGEGVTLSAEPTYLHIAVPEGVYNELYVTLYDKAGGVMYATVNTNEKKPLTAGNVREFTNHIAYKATETLHIIKDAESLKALATTTSDAILINDIDLSEVEWTPIEGYASYTLNGNGYAIKGLKAPLFGTTGASIRGLHLTDVNINETAEPKVGAFAKTILATSTITPKVENCSASGKITVNCPDFIPGTASTHSVVCVGGLVAHSEGVSYSKCTNNVELDIKQIVSTSNTVKLSPCVGGVVGFANGFIVSDTNAVVGSFVECINNGDITYIDHSFTGAVSAQTYKGAYLSVRIGGVVGESYSTGNALTYETPLAHSLVNNGNLLVKSHNDSQYTGGVIGESYMLDIDNVKNYGTVTISESKDIRHIFGGVVGVVQSGKLNRAHNYGKLTVEKSSYIANGELGGVVGYSKIDVTNSTNNAELYFGVNILTRTTVYGSDKAIGIGGVVGVAGKKVTNCSNLGSKMSIVGELHNASKGADAMCVGGVVGKSGAATSNLVNTSEVIYDASLTYPANSNASQGRINLAGCVGYINAAKGDNLSNSGKISVDGVIDGAVFLGGISGHVTNGLSNSTNSGVISIGNKADTTKLNSTSTSYFAGIVGCMKKASSKLHNTESGSIIFGNVVSAGEIEIGGIAGTFICGETNAVNESEAKNDGDITINGTYNGRFFCAGICGYGADKAVFSGAVNSGDITIHKDAVFNATNGTYIGGVAGINRTSVSDTENNGTITVSGTFNNLTYIAGNTAWAWTGGALSNPVNKGNIVIKDATFAKNASDDSKNDDADYDATKHTTAYIAGCIATLNKNSANNLHTGGKNSGSITIENTTAFKCWPLIAGCIAYSQSAISDFENTGAIVTKTGTNFPRNLYLSGGVAHAVADVDNVTNRGALTVNATASMRLKVGGCLGYSTTTASNLNNYGTILSEATMSTGSGAVWLAGTAFWIEGDASKLYNHQSGTITANLAASSSHIHLSGIANRINGSLIDAENTAAVTVNGVCGNTLTLTGGLAQIGGGTSSTRENVVNRGAISLNAKGIANAFVGGIAGNGGSVGSYKNCHNYGDITLGKDVTISGKLSLGGLLGKQEGASGNLIYMDNCSNDSNISVQGLIAKSNSLNVGGIVGHHQVDALIVKEGGLLNKGTISVEVSEVSADKAVYIGGILACSNPAVEKGEETWTGVIRNEASITVNDKVGRIMNIGGLFGGMSRALSTTETLSYINTGNITCTGEAINSSTLIGGITGKGLALIANATSVCNIVAVNYPNVGAITGATRSDSVIAFNCKAGGTICKKVFYNEEADADTPVTETLTANNYHLYLYGTAVSADQAVEDLCSYASAVE